MKVNEKDVFTQMFVQTKRYFVSDGEADALLKSLILSCSRLSLGATDRECAVLSL